MAKANCCQPLTECATDEVTPWQVPALPALPCLCPADDCSLSADMQETKLEVMTLLRGLEMGWWEGHSQLCVSPGTSSFPHALPEQRISFCITVKMWLWCDAFPISLPQLSVAIHPCQLWPPSESLAQEWVGGENTSASAGSEFTVFGFPCPPVLLLQLPFTLYFLDFHVFAISSLLEKQGAPVSTQRKGRKYKYICCVNNIKHLCSSLCSSLGVCRSALKLSFVSQWNICHPRTKLLKTL